MVGLNGVARGFEFFTPERWAMIPRSERSRLNPTLLSSGGVVCFRVLTAEEADAHLDVMMAELIRASRERRSP